MNVEMQSYYVESSNNPKVELVLTHLYKTA